MEYKHFDELCKKLVEVYRKWDKEAYYKVEEPATVDMVEAAENRLGMRLPEQLRNFFLQYSRKADMCVFLPDEFCDELPKELEQIFSACFELSLEGVEREEENRKGWVDACFPNPENEYDRVWHGKLGIISVGNGDVIALDIQSNPQNPSVVYLSHDDGEGHGVILGKDFDRYLLSLVEIGACGTEDWQMLPFISDRENGINPDCENAVMYRKLIGFEIEDG